MISFKSFVFCFFIMIGDVSSASAAGMKIRSCCKRNKQIALIFSHVAPKFDFSINLKYCKTLNTVLIQLSLMIGCSQIIQEKKE